MGVCQRFKSNMIYFDIKAVHCNTIFYASVSNLKGTPLSCLDNVRSASRVSHHNTVWGVFEVSQMSQHTFQV